MDWKPCNKSDYKDMELFEGYNTNKKILENNNIRIETEVSKNPNKYTQDKNNEK